MVRSGNQGALGDKAALAQLKRMGVTPDRRIPYVCTSIGDSRSAAVYLDGTQRNRNSRSALNVANSLLGHRLVIGPTFGVSGDRTDNLFARMPLVLATNAGLCHYWVGLNNLAQVATGVSFEHAVTKEPVSIGNVAEVGARDVREHLTMLSNAGITTIVEQEMGGDALTTQEKITAFLELRQRIAELCDVMPNVRLSDPFTTMMQPLQTTPKFKPNMVYDTTNATHENARGGYRHAKATLVPIISSIIGPRPSVLSRAVFENPTNGRRQLLLNNLFTNTSGGNGGATSTTGVTGTVPASFTTSLASASVSLSYGANDDGVGNYTQAVIDFTAAAGTFRLNQAIDPVGGNYDPRLVPGEWIEAVAEVEVIGNPTVFAGASLEINGFNGTAAYGSMDGGMPATPGANGFNDAGIDEPCVLTLRTRPVQIEAKVGSSNPYVAVILRVRSTGAGQVTLRIRQISLRRRVAG